MEITGIDVSGAIVTVHLSKIDWMVELAGVTATIGGDPYPVTGGTHLPEFTADITIDASECTQAGNVYLQFPRLADPLRGPQYDPNQGPTDQNEPWASSINPNPPDVRKGDQVTLRGQRLGPDKLRSVVVGTYAINLFRIQTPNQVMFLVPQAIPDSTLPTTARIILIDAAGNRIQTRFRLNIS